MSNIEITAAAHAMKLIFDFESNDHSRYSQMSDKQLHARFTQVIAEQSLGDLHPIGELISLLDHDLIELLNNSYHSLKHLIEVITPTSNKQECAKPDLATAIAAARRKNPTLLPHKLNMMISAKKRFTPAESTYLTNICDISMGTMMTLLGEEFQCDQEQCIDVEGVFAAWRDFTATMLMDHGKRYDQWTECWQDFIKLIV